VKAKKIKEVVDKGCLVQRFKLIFHSPPTRWVETICGKVTNSVDRISNTNPTPYYLTLPLCLMLSQTGGDD